MNRPVGYWWDFRHHENDRMTCIVECDHPKANGRILAEFDEPIRAMRCIEDLRAGRLSMHELLKGKAHDQ